MSHSNSMGEIPKAISVVIMFSVSSVSMLFVQSSSGLAATLMPIMAPLAGVNFFAYLKKASRFVFTVYIPISVLALVLMTIFNYQ